MCPKDNDVTQRRIIQRDVFAQPPATVVVTTINDERHSGLKIKSYPFIRASLMLLNRNEGKTYYNNHADIRRAFLAQADCH